MKFYPHLKEDMLRVVVVHPGEVILPELGEGLGRYAQKSWLARGGDSGENQGRWLRWPGGYAG